MLGAPGRVAMQLGQRRMDAGPGAVTCVGLDPSYGWNQTDPSAIVSRSPVTVLGGSLGERG